MFEYEGDIHAERIDYDKADIFIKSTLDTTCININCVDVLCFKNSLDEGQIYNLIDRKINLPEDVKEQIYNSCIKNVERYRIICNL